MARVSGPLFSLSASGTIGKAFTFLTWKGIPVCREWFRPANPQTAGQVNVRTALTLTVALWQALPDVVKTTWNTFAEGTQMSGFNQWVKRAMKEYIVQLGSDTLPVSVVCADNPPDETWTWSDV